MIHHRASTPTLILVLAALMLPGCAPSSPAPAKSGPQMVRDRLAAADDAPYSAALDAVTLSGTRRLQHMTGRVNLNAPFTGRTKDETEQYTEDVVITQQKVYRRATGSRDAWQEFPASAAKGGTPVDRLPQYVALILEHGGSVHRGSEPVRVSGHLTPKEIASVDRTSGRNLRPARAIDADVWIDEKGRIVRVRQDIHFTSEPDVRSTLTLTDFRDAVPVSAPSAR